MLKVADSEHPVFVPRTKQTGDPATRVTRSVIDIVNIDSSIIDKLNCEQKYRRDEMWTEWRYLEATTGPSFLELS